MIAWMPRRGATHKGPMRAAVREMLLPEGLHFAIGTLPPCGGMPPRPAFARDEFPPGAAASERPLPESVRP